MSQHILIDALRYVVEKLKEDYLISSRDEITRSIENIYTNYYAVNTLNPVDSNDWFIFVDAGFKPYALDVAVVTPVQFGALIRDENGIVRKISDILNKPCTDSILLYAGRRRVGTEHDFRISISTMNRENLLFENSSSCIRISEKLSEIVRNFAGSTGLTRKSRFFVKLANYIESLIELTYGLKTYILIKEKLGIDPYVVLDGTLIKWFSIKKRVEYDGLDIVATILETDVKDVKAYLSRVVGLSKTTKFTTIARSYSIFVKAENKSSWKSRGFYTTINTVDASKVIAELEKLFEKQISESFIKEIVRTLCRIVFNKHMIYVARFPVTADQRTIFVIDVYIDKPVIKVDRGKVYFDNDAAEEVNNRLRKIVPQLFSIRSKLTGEPPYGYMEVDQLVRLPSKISRVFETVLINYMRSLNDPSLTPLIQAFTTTLYMRYGYRE
ncbi:MAG: hypothetical protein QXT88_00850 [Desulfurococcaceae archaeon]